MCAKVLSSKSTKSINSSRSSGWLGSLCSKVEKPNWISSRAAKLAPERTLTHSQRKERAKLVLAVLTFRVGFVSRRILHLNEVKSVLNAPSPLLDYSA